MSGLKTHNSQQLLRMKRRINIQACHPLIILMMLVVSSRILQSQSVDIGIRGPVYKSCVDTVGERLYILKNDSLLVINLNKFRIEERMRLHSDYDLSLARFEPQFVNGKFHVFDQEGGMVLQRELDSLKRIDLSFEHRMQTLSTFFCSHDTIFRFGGYGYWSPRNFFTLYSKTSRDWQAISPLGSKSVPPGMWSSIVHQAGNEWFIVFGSTMLTNDLTSDVPCKEVWSFDRNKLKWVHYGDLKMATPKFSVKIPYRDKLLLIEQNRLLRIDFLRNRVEILQKNRSYEIFTLVPFNSFYYNGAFYIIHLAHQDNRVQIMKAPEVDFFGPLLETARLYSTNSAIKTLICLLAGFLLILLFWLAFRRLQLRKNKIHTAGNQLTYKARRIELDDLQLALLNLLLSKEEVTSDEIIEVIGNDRLHSTQNIRTKNFVIDQLNLKFNVLLGTGEKIITIGPSRIDKRMRVYRLKGDCFFI
jgi:hypothetical protein